MKKPYSNRLLLTALFAISTTVAAANPWSTRHIENPDGPGMAMDILYEGNPSARLIYGEGQMKPFLHVFGLEGELLTNPGVDAEGDTAGRFPHHRGIFIGWNRVRSELGNDDLWHLRRNESMEVTDIRTSAVTDDYAEIVAEIVWRSSNKDDAGDNTLLRETRTLRISKPDGQRNTTVDATFTLTAARDLSLGGDLQHAGVHFRAHRDVNDRANETIYMWDPDVDGGRGRIVNPEMRWCRLVYPISDQWYSTIQLNAPSNPTEELSWRDYGRFGFFFKREMQQDESFTINYRFITSPVRAPGENGFDQSMADAIRKLSDEAYQTYAEHF